MQALWVEDEKLSLRTDVAVPVVPDGEALVRVLLAGICNTDLELLRGYYPFTGILGHEFVGIVEQGPEELVNRRVVGEINASCGICEACREGRRTHCEKRTVLGIHDRNGAFAEFLTLPIENLHPIPAGISLEAAVFAEPLAAALEIQEQIEFASNDRVLVVGDGKLGQLIGQTLALTGCHLTVAGRHSEKLDRLAKRGIETVLATDLGARRFDIAVDCTGNPGGFEVARQALRPRGTLVLKSTYADRLTIDASSISTS